MARGKWTTSLSDRGKAQYQADQIAQAGSSGSGPDEYQLLQAILYELQQIRVLLAAQQRPAPQQWPHQG